MQTTIKQNMSNHPMTVRYKDDLSSAYIRMKREGYRHMPVIDDHGNIVGLISDRDFQRAMGPTTTADAHGLPTGPDFPNGAKVSNYMSRPVKSLPEETELLVAIQLMIKEKISAIAITKNDVMTGIITHEDLLRVLAAHLQKPHSPIEKALALTYDSSLGKFSEALAVAGI